MALPPFGLTPTLIRTNLFADVDGFGGGYGNLSAMAAIKEDGSVFAWGNTTNGGTLPAAAAALLDGSVRAVRLFSTSDSFAALREDGSVVTWGNAGRGGDSAAVSDGSAVGAAGELSGGVIAVYSTGRAYAALKSDGSVVTWGAAGSGGDSSAVAANLTNVADIAFTGTSFAALRTDGSVVTWGNVFGGGDSSAVAAQLNGTIGVTKIFDTGGAFAALRADGSVVTWGDQTQGGNSSAVASQLNGTIDVVEIFGARRAFAALRADGSVVAWGDFFTGGSVVDGFTGRNVAEQLNGTIDVVTIRSNANAFAALRADGSVVTWGLSSSGGDSSLVASQLDGTIPVVRIFSTQQAFAALRSDGSVVTWGAATMGGDSSAVAAELDGTIDVVSIYMTDEGDQFANGVGLGNVSAFAALRADGSVVVWGGGEESVVPDDKKPLLASGVLTITSNRSTFAAIKADGSIVTWGQAGTGGAGTATNGRDESVNLAGGNAGLVCFLRGTLILSDRGEVPVEDLRAGDLVVVQGGMLRPVKWIGRQAIRAAVVRAHPFAQPVVVKAGALGDGLPWRDLKVSPQHGLQIDGVIVPAAALVNGVSIVRDRTPADLAYFHIELDGHEVIFAEGAATETFVDHNSRAMFDNAHEYVRLHGASSARPVEQPRLEEGRHLAEIRRRVAAYAGIAPRGSTGEMIHNLERIERGVLHGWAVDTGGAEAVEADVLVAGQVVGRIVANRYRADLDQACLAEGRGGFTFAVPAYVTSIAEVSLRRVDTGEVPTTLATAQAA